VTSIAGVVLAAGLGTRLRPLTELRPKALCPVNNVALVDHAIARVSPFVDAVAVNVHAHADQMRAHLDGRMHMSYEGRPLGTAGALGQLRPWIDGRAVLTTNADAWCGFTLDALVAGWDGVRTRVVVVHDAVRGDFGDWRFAGSCLLPWSEVARLDREVSDLYQLVWAPKFAAGELELVTVDGRFVDCGTPSDYLFANLLASGGRSVIGTGAVVRGRIERSVLWDGVEVGPTEHLVECVRASAACTVAAPLGERRRQFRDGR
jgi:N-acetyl-alpha-D-muramate 1-phosphate uridylyltransferase